jgi:hypothetical protein
MAKMSGGTEFRAVLTKMAAKLSKPNSVRIGFLEGSTEPDGTSIPMIAAIQEFGAPRAHIPPRPFFRNMISEKSPGWPDAIAANLKATDYNVPETLRRIGAGIAGQLQKSIVKTNTPPLSPVTVMLRGMKSKDQSLVVNRTVVEQARARVEAGLTNYGASTKPLIEHGNLFNAVGFEVKT